MGISRSVIRYQVKAKDDDPLRTRLRELALEYPRYGYQTLPPILQREGLVIDPKMTYRMGGPASSAPSKTEETAATATISTAAGDSAQSTLVDEFQERSVGQRPTVSSAQYRR